MPFVKAQEVIRKILPEALFNPLYGLVCNTYDLYHHISDRTLFIFPLIKATIKGDLQEILKIDTVQKALPYTMVSKIGVALTHDIAVITVIKNIQGAFVECGVARGGCAFVLSRVAHFELKNRKTWLFDSFEGLPPPTDKDGEQKPVRHKHKKGYDLAKGYCLGTYGEVKHLLFDKYHFSKDNVLMVKGWFNETLPKYKHDVGDIAVLRLDGDWYESTMCCLNNLYDNVVSGGYIIIDDYNLPGCKKAVDEFREAHNINSGLFLDDNGRCYWTK